MPTFRLIPGPVVAIPGTVFAAATLAVVVPSNSLSAQASESEEPFVEPPISFQGPPIPRAPEVITRDGAGNATVRAIRLSEPLDVDGTLDEPVYREVPAVSGFIQSVPDEGEPATEKTEAWVLFDDEYVYISARIHEEVPESEWVANDMRRDGDNIGNNDNFGVVLDTYYDRRNGYFFYTNPLGGMADIQLTNEGSPNFDWNPVWDVQTGRFPGGWTLEMAIPFQSLRYRPGAPQIWGLQLRRGIQRKNEWSHLTLVSSAAAGTGRMGATRVSRAATLVGLEAPAVVFNIDLKPYGIAGLRTDLGAAPPTRNEEHGDWGVDLKWGVTENLTADLTYNTDFAQVEVDEQQVNLTRFSLFFPEKREFFLESRGIFDFPTVGAGSGGGGATPTLFFSRRIGLHGGEPVPIVAGGRLTGKVGSFDVGALGIRTDALAEVGAETTDFTVFRVKRDLFSRSNVGALYARRSSSLLAAALTADGDGSGDGDARAGDAGAGANETYAADASLTFADDWYLSGYYAATRTEGLPASSPVGEVGESYQSRFSYDGDERGFDAGFLVVEDAFNPEVGFLRRGGFEQGLLSARLSPRPESVDWIRQATLEGSVNYLTDHREGFLETREVAGRFQLELESSDMLTLRYADSYELLEEAFRIHEGVTIPPGRYPFAWMEAGYTFGPQRWASGRVTVRHGDFYDGTLTSVGLGRGRVEVSQRLTVEPSITWNRVELPHGSFDTFLSLARLIYSFTPRMFFTGLVQYNSSNDAFGTNLRLRWEYAPGSEIFVVYTEERDTDVLDRFSELSNRGLVVKATRLLRF